MRIWYSIILAAILCGGWTFPIHGQEATAPTTRPLTPAEELEFKTFSSQLADPTVSLKTKTDAAELLLTRPYPQAAEALKAFLADGANQTAQAAIADALTRQPGPVQLVDPLLAMLSSSDPAVRSAAARALTTYKDPVLVDRLIQTMTDSKQDKSARLALISAMQRVLDKKSVNALIGLLDDSDAAIRDATMESLAKLTGIRTFGNDRRQWKAWWQQNHQKEKTVWLTELADSLSKSKSALEVDNAQLNDRLTKAIQDLYAATPTAQRDILLLGLLKEPLSEVRLAGQGLVQKKIEAGTEEVSPEIRAQVRLMLSDTDSRVRENAAMVLANLNDAETLPALMDRLKIEESAPVQAALLTAMGQLRDPAAIGVVLDALNSKYDSVCAAAASALGRIASKQPLQGKQKADAVKALCDKYSQVTRAGQLALDGVTVRESLLGAMGLLGSRDVIPLLQDALTDPMATVRLAAVTALARMNDATTAQALVSMVGDSDRGVRQAALMALGASGSDKFLPVILSRTDPARESEADVRQQAWDTSLSLLANANETTLGGVCDLLRGRSDASAQYIRILQMLVDKLKTAQSPDLAARQTELADALLKADRPAEAAMLLGEAYAGMNARSPQAQALWNQWVNCLLQADDASVSKVLADQSDDKLFDAGMTRLRQHLQAMIAADKYLGAIAMLQGAMQQLPQRLTEEQRSAFQKMLLDCQARQVQIDRQRVSKLALQLIVADELARKAATSELTLMGERAVAPLIAELRNNITASKPNAEEERAILLTLKQLAPRLRGFEPTAPLADRLKIIEAWEKSASTQPQ